MRIENNKLSSQLELSADQSYERRKTKKNWRETIGLGVEDSTSLAGDRNNQKEVRAGGHQLCHIPVNQRASKLLRISSWPVHSTRYFIPTQLYNNPSKQVSSHEFFFNLTSIIFFICIYFTHRNSLTTKTILYQRQ